VLISKTMSNICNCSVTTGSSQTDVNGQGRVNLSISCWIILFILHCVYLSQTDLNGQVLLNHPVHVALCMYVLSSLQMSSFWSTKLYFCTSARRSWSWFHHYICCGGNDTTWSQVVNFGFWVWTVMNKQSDS